MKRFFIVLILVLTTVTLLGSSTHEHRSQWRDFLSREGTNWRTTFRDSGRLRAVYGKSVQAWSESGMPSNLVRDYYALFGVDHAGDLRLERKDLHDTGSLHVYRQYIAGIPVERAEVHLNFDRDFHLISASSTAQPGLKVKPATIISDRIARDRAISVFNGEAVTGNATLVLLPAGKIAKPAWRVEVASKFLSEGSRLVYVDATDPRIVLRVLKTFASAEGQGTVFMENPVVTPSTSMETFKNMDNSTSLVGKFVRLYNANSEYAVSGFTVDLSNFTTASDPNRQYNYLTTDARFSEAMGYFHINRVHDQWQSFGFNKLNKKFPVFVNALSRNGKGLDNAFYNRLPPKFPFGFIVMGAGDNLGNLGHDADVYYHEYGHAVLDRTKPEFFEAIDSNYPWAFHEGFSDVSAAAITGNPKIGEFGLRTKDSKKFFGRNIDNNNRYPNHVLYPPWKKSESHHTGLIFGGAWWDLQKRIGPEKAQRILYESLRLLPIEMNFFDVRDAMLTADHNQNGGANEAAINEAFGIHGLSGPNPGQRGTVTVSALKTAQFVLPSGKIQLKTAFKKGDIIQIRANYTGSGLTLGYNLIAERFEVEGPDENFAAAFAWFDEVVNGNNTGKNGALQAEIVTHEGTKAGTYTVTIHSRLGGTSQTTTPRSVSFRIKE